MPTFNSVSIGNAGEFFAASVLQREFKTIAFASSQSSYDLIAEDYNGKFFKCQVKTTQYPKQISNYRYWRWRTVRHKNVIYKNSDIDFFALVALDANLVYFCLPEDMKGVIFYRREDRLDVDIESQSCARVLEKLCE
tara:strand:+ start:1286 stop:1696 length:411 start_codon:yes stop_codon:yes gene_type:complete